MIEAYITYRESIAEQRRSSRKPGHYMPIMSNIRSTARFFIEEKDMSLIEDICRSRGWEIETRGVYPSTPSNIINQLDPKTWTIADDIEHREVVARMYPKGEV